MVKLKLITTLLRQIRTLTIIASGQLMRLYFKHASIVFTWPSSINLHVVINWSYQSCLPICSIVSERDHYSQLIVLHVLRVILVFAHWLLSRVTWQNAIVINAIWTSIHIFRHIEHFHQIAHLTTVQINLIFLGGVEGWQKKLTLNNITVDILTHSVIPSIRSWISINQAQINFI